MFRSTNSHVQTKNGSLIKYGNKHSKRNSRMAAMHISEIRNRVQCPTILTFESDVQVFDDECTRT